MNHEIDSMERFVAQLRELKPAMPGTDLQTRLERALRETPIVAAPAAGKVIYHPFFQWAAAAAALVTALFLSIESTEHRDASHLSQTPPGVPAASEVNHVYQLVNGKLVPSSTRAAMIQTAYRGIEVIQGKAYRKFGHGQESFLELIEATAKAD